MFLYELWKLGALQVVVVAFLFTQSSCNSRPVRLIATVWNLTFSISLSKEEGWWAIGRSSCVPLYIINGSGSSYILVDLFFYFALRCSPVHYYLFSALKITSSRVSTLSKMVYSVWRIQSLVSSTESILWNPSRHISVEFNLMNYVLYFETLKPWLEIKSRFKQI